MSDLRVPTLPFTDQLAFERTRLAAERTMLSYVRTAIGIVGGGVGLMFLRHAALVVTGTVAIAVGLLIAGYGLFRHRVAIGALRGSARDYAAKAREGAGVAGDPATPASDEQAEQADDSR